jgi:hypothetical protein
MNTSLAQLINSQDWSIRAMAVMIGLSVVLCFAANWVSAQEVVEILWLDSHSTSSNEFSGPAIGSELLGGEIPYLVEVKGTYSAWSSFLWVEVCAGTPELLPQFESPGVQNGPVGIDAANTFSWPKASSTLCPGGEPHIDPPFSVRRLQFSVDGGGEWLTAEPLDPEFNPDHIYIYEVIGADHPLQARLLASPPTDDYGQLRITIKRTFLEVPLDIKPGSYPNSINLGSNGVVPVAILSIDNFSAVQVDPDTVELAGAGVAVKGKGSKSMSHEEDINGDSLTDLVVQVETENLDPAEFQNGKACLTGQTYQGQSIKGCDEIAIVPTQGAPPLNPKHWLTRTWAAIKSGY